MNFHFPLFGDRVQGLLHPNGSLKPPKWIEEKHQPDLNLIYLPHLDYDLQRYGPNDPRCEKALHEIDELAGSLIDFLNGRGIECIVLSEYGITQVDKVIYPNRHFRHQGWLNIKEEFGLETLDSGGSKAFAITDHQIAHIYLQDNDSKFRSKLSNPLNQWMEWQLFWKEKSESKQDWTTPEAEI